jgi:NAD(P)H dehydrogenase (quinone)
LRGNKLSLQNPAVFKLKTTSLSILFGLFASLSLAQNDCASVGFHVTDTSQPRILIVVAHPDPNSFNQAIKEHIVAALKAQNHQVRVRDLYQLGFDPVLSLEELQRYDSQKGEVPADVKAEQDEILWADHLIFIYPTWWWSMPAVMKGYCDRVFVPGFAFEVVDQGIKGLLEGKTAWIIQTTGSDQAYIAENGLDKMVKTPMEIGLFNFCGIEVVDHQILAGVPFVTDEEREEMLEGLKEAVRENF